MCVTGPTPHPVQRPPGQAAKPREGLLGTTQTVGSGGPRGGRQAGSVQTEAGKEEGGPRAAVGRDCAFL